MPANIGEMFYVGEPPWHKEGAQLARPASLDEALEAGGLKWDVADVDLMTGGDPPSPVPKRKALVRLDRPPGHPGRVVGVVHRSFAPIQNADAGRLFDAVFGQGHAVYHTGGYLGNGEVVWLLARVNRTIRVGRDDDVECYALMANSHDGSLAFNIRLTTVRVVCQNTLALAMEQNLRPAFRRAHHGSFLEHARAAHEFFDGAIRRFDGIGASFARLAGRRCSDDQLRSILQTLLPDPKEPPKTDRNSAVRTAWVRRLEETRKARAEIARLCVEGIGMSMAGASGTFWGVLNAVLEYVDHHREVKGSRLAYSLLGDGMELKLRAYRTIRQAEIAA